MSLDQKPVILVADDTPVNLSVLLDLLGQSDFEVLIAEDGESALERATYARPDLILLDILMPQPDGFATCERLKAEPETRDIPVIFMTALADTIDKVRGFAVGAVDYVTKPFQPEELLARVRAQLTIRRLQSKLRESEERLSRAFESAMDAIVTIDEAGRVRLFNAAAERVFRCTAADTVGTPFARFLSEAFRAMIADHLREDPGRPVWLTEGLTAFRADGEEFPVEATLSRVDAAREPLVTIILRDANERRRAEAASRQLEDEVRATLGIGELVGASAALARTVKSIEQVGLTDSTVLVCGETGTGKELVARAIHARSRRKDKVLVKVNCAAIPAGLIESELFGHERGAFTGAVARKIGRFELADRGTIFLDEIGELPLDLQPKLLRVLQEQEFVRVGGIRTIKIDVRLVAATNRDLVQMVDERRFREDLYYRLNVFPIYAPPLRECPEDIEPLVRHFAQHFAARMQRRIEVIPTETLDALCRHAWPGNVRELENLIERAVILSTGPRLTVPLEHLARRSTPLARGDSESTLELVKRAHVIRVLEETNWIVGGARGAAARLGMKRTTLQSYMKRLAIERRV
ncbi:MAG TPA: sigma 54-interacting transcriptional regulator [Candidatus Binatia bacterium]|nr:sigma 54-interacting transcriptional regulator [Candidatus Binatia bacterium]